MHPLSLPFVPNTSTTRATSRSIPLELSIKIAQCRAFVRMAISAPLDPFVVIAASASSRPTYTTRDRSTSTSLGSMAPRRLDASSIPAVPIPPSLRDSPYLNSPYSVFRSVYSPQRPVDEHWLMDTIPMGSPHAIDDLQVGVGVNGQVHSISSLATGNGTRARSDSRAPQLPIQTLRHHGEAMIGTTTRNPPPGVQAERRGSVQNGATLVKNSAVSYGPGSQIGPTASVVPSNSQNQTRGHHEQQRQRQHALPPSSFNFEFDWSDGRHARSVSAPNSSQSTQRGRR